MDGEKRISLEGNNHLFTSLFFFKNINKLKTLLFIFRVSPHNGLQGIEKEKQKINLKVVNLKWK